MEGPELDQALEDRILQLLADRDPGKTICPSDVARSLHADLRQSDPDGWRALMQPTRDAAARLVAAGEVVVTRAGEVVDVREARGPVRIRRA